MLGWGFRFETAARSTSPAAAGRRRAAGGRGGGGLVAIVSVLSRLQVKVEARDPGVRADAVRVEREDPCAEHRRGARECHVRLGLGLGVRVRVRHRVKVGVSIRVRVRVRG